MTQEICDKAVDTYSVSDEDMTQEMCDNFVSNEPFMLKYHPDKYNIQDMRDKAIAFCLITLKLVPNWFVKNKCLKNLTILYFLLMISLFMMNILVLSHSYRYGF